MPSLETPELALGKRLRAARKTAGVTLAALSGKTGLSQALLSRIETGKVSTSVANLLTIARQLGVKIGSLLDEEAGVKRRYAVARRRGPRPVIRVIDSNGYTYEPLVHGWNGQLMDAFLLTFPPGNRADVLVSHEGEELIYILKGKVLFHLGDEQVPLKEGDCIYFNSELSHMAKNIGKTQACALMITCPGRGPGGQLLWWAESSRAARKKSEDGKGPIA